MGVTHTFNCGIADDPGAQAAGQILPSHWNATHTVSVDLASEVTGTLPVANGGTGTATPSLVAGTNVTISGTWPNQTINASGGGGGGTPGGVSGDLQYNNAGAFGGITPGTGVSTALTQNVTGSGGFVLAGSPTLTTPNLGTPSAATLTNATGLPVSTGISGLGTGVATFLATPSSANLAAAVTDETGSGSLVFATSPTLTTPNLGTPSALTLTNATGLPVGGISATGTPSASTYLRGDGSWQSVSASPSGSNTQVQYNNSGSFGGSANFTFSGSTVGIGAAGAATGAVALGGATSGTVTLTAAATAGTWTLTLPTSAGTNGYVLQTDGSGNTSWVAQSGGGGGITIGTTTITSGTSNRILYDNAGVVGEKAVTGTGDVVLATSPTLVTPLLGTPTSGTLTNCTGLPVGGISATGTPSSTTYLRGDGSWQTISSGGGTKTLARFTPLDNQPPASNFATLDTRNSVALLDFDAATDESAVFVGVINQGATLTSGIKVTISWAASTATSGDCVWGAQFEKTTGQDIDADSFDTATTATTTTSGTSGVVNTTSITCTSIDSLAAGDCFRVKIYRDADAAGDTMTGDAELVAVELQQVA